MSRHWSPPPALLTAPARTLQEAMARRRAERSATDSAKYEHKVRACDDGRLAPQSPGGFSPAARERLVNTPNSARMASRLVHEAERREEEQLPEERVYESRLAERVSPPEPGPPIVLREEDEALLHEPAGSNGEFASKKCLQEAIALMKAVPREHFASAGSGDSRLVLDEDEADAEILERLKRMGGKNGESNAHLRILIVDMEEFMTERNGAPTPALPIAAVDAEKFKAWLASKDKKQTASDRISRVLEYAARVGLPVCGKSPLLSAAPTKRLSGGGRSGAKARDAPTPWMIQELERSCDAEGEEAKFQHEPALDYCRHAFMLLKSGNRHAGYADAAWKEPPADMPGCNLLEVQEDKGRRLKVPLYIPVGGYTQLECSWEEEWVAKYKGAPSLYLEWVGFETPPDPVYGKTSVINGEALADPWSPCHPEKASKALCHVMEMVAELTHEEMVEECLSGVHIFRHVGAVTTILADWPELEGNVVGDWATQKKRVEGAAATKKGKGVASSVRGSYALEVVASKQLAIRKRYLDMMQAAFGIVRAGLKPGEPFPRGITWEELFPPKPPLALEDFYGALYTQG